MSATEKLVAEYGIEAVNLRDVGREADQRNNSVVQYHFGTKEILVSAVIDSRLPALDARLRASLDELSTTGQHGDLGALAAVLVDSLMELDEAEADRCFLGFLAALATAPHWRPMLTEREDYLALVHHVTAAVAAASGLSTEAALTRLGFAWSLLVVTLGNRDRDIEATTIRAELIDALSGLLSAPRVVADASN